MPKTSVIFFRDSDGAVPLLDWLQTLNRRARAKCIARVRRLAAYGHELRRPEADYLRDGIYELRVGLQGLNYRLLYFFHGRTAAVVSHGLVKRRVVPDHEIDLALRRKRQFEAEPEHHSFQED